MTAGESIVYILVPTPVIYGAVHRSLVAAGLSVRTLQAAHDCLALPVPDVPTCFVLSVDLPDLSGLELQQRIGRNGVPIVFISDGDRVAESVRAMKAGAVDFLAMPLDEAELTRAVHVALDLDRRRRAERGRFVDLQRRYLQLTPREREALSLIAAGLLNKQAASMMGISQVTLQIHRGQIMRKMRAGSFAELVRMAVALRIDCPRAASFKRGRPAVFGTGFSEGAFN